MKKIILAALAALALLLTGCTTVSTGPDEVAVAYKGGSFSSKKFKNCVEPSNRQVDGPSDFHATYPASQRNVVFDTGGDIKPITFVTKDGIEMTATGVLNFRLNTQCKPLRKFHELIGNREQAFREACDDCKPGETSKGWNDKVLPVYLGRPLDTAVDRAGQAYNYAALYNDPAVKQKWEQLVISKLPALVNRQTDGAEVFFQGFSITLQKPDPPKAIKDKLRERQTAIAEADTRVAKAKGQRLAAEEELGTKEAEAAKKRAEIEGFRLPGMTAAQAMDAYNKARMIEKGLNPEQPTYLVNSTR